MPPLVLDLAPCLQIETPRTGSQLENSTKYVKAHMDAYFERMDKMSKLPNLEVRCSTLNVNENQILHRAAWSNIC